jgi:hypothetical protein
MPPDKMTPCQLVGWIVRDGIINQGMPYSEASRRWGMSLPTLNRLMNTGKVSLRFYRIAERNLGLPTRFLEMIADRDVDAIRRLSGVDEYVRSYILKSLREPTDDLPHQGRSV